MVQTFTGNVTKWYAMLNNSTFFLDSNLYDIFVYPMFGTESR